MQGFCNSADQKDKGKKDVKGCKKNKDNKNLAKKTVCMYNYMEALLSKQTHYDFGMRALNTNLKCEGSFRLSNPTASDSKLICQAIYETTITKLVTEDKHIFEELLKGIFTKMAEHQEPDSDALLDSIGQAILQRHLQLNEYQVPKIVQLLSMEESRHGNMLVGKTLSGKTIAWKLIIDVLNLIAEKNKSDPKKLYYKPKVINSKSMTIDNLFGYFEKGLIQSEKMMPIRIWHEGVFAVVLREACEESLSGLKKEDIKPKDASDDNLQKKMQNVKKEGSTTDAVKKEGIKVWVILDGPVDLQWMESLNSLLDDNKMLTLSNGDRVRLTKNVNIFFEVDNLEGATPSIISRTGMMYFDGAMLGYMMIYDSWLLTVKDERIRKYLEELGSKYITKIFNFAASRCKAIISLPQINIINSFCSLLESQIPANPDADYLSVLEKQFIFSLVWAVGGVLDDQSRKDIDSALRDIESILPQGGTVYDFFVSVEKNEWVSWQDKVIDIKFDKEEVNRVNFMSVQIQITENLRLRQICSSLMQQSKNILLVQQETAKPHLLESSQR